MIQRFVAILIVSLPAGLPAQVSEWRLSAQPVLRIGEVEGDRPYMFSGIGSVLKLADGRVLVADGQSNEIRVFDARGKFVVSHGREGRGPGEFQWLQGLWPIRGDTLLAMDQRVGRITWLSPSFVPVRTTQRQIWAQGATHDGSLFMIGNAPEGGALKSDAVTVYDGLIIRVNPQTEALDTLARTAASRFFFKATTTNGQAGMVRFPIPFAASASYVIGREVIAYGAGTRPEIERFDSKGRRLSPIRLASAPRPVTRADVQRFEKWQLDLARTPAQRDRLQQALSEVKPAETMPAHGDLRLDFAGNLWVQRYATPWEPSPPWDVYSNAGKLIATARVPPRFTIREIGNDYVLGISRDEFDVERVELYRLTK